MLNNNSLLLFGNPTSSDVQFMLSYTRNMSFDSLSSTSSTLSSTRSDAQSAPPELERVFNKICEKCEDLVLLSNRQVPPEWTMPDLVRAVCYFRRSDWQSGLSDFLLLRSHVTWPKCLVMRTDFSLFRSNQLCLLVPKMWNKFREKVQTITAHLD